MFGLDVAAGSAAGPVTGVNCESRASSAAIRALSASESSRAIRAISLTASNSSRLTTSRSRRKRSAWLRNSVSNSRRTPCATPAASFISRATSSKNRFVVCTMLASALAAAAFHCYLRPPRLETMAMVQPPRKGREATSLTSACGKPYEWPHWHDGQRESESQNASSPGHSVSRDRSGPDFDRPVCGALVCAGLYRRHYRRLVFGRRDYFVAKAVGRPCPAHRDRFRRLRHLDHARHHSRRPDWLCAVLQSCSFRRQSA